MNRFFDGFPFELGWELTLACNLRCRHCASSAGAPRPNELNLNEAIAIADQLPELLVLEVVFTGGEPLMSPLWEGLACHLNSLGIRVGMVTNATNLDEATIARLKAAGVTGIAVSLDGLEATHDHIRGVSGMFRRVQAGLRRVLTAGLQVTVITTVSGRSIDELPRMLPVLREIGVKRWQLQPIFALGRTRESSELQLTTDAYLRLIDFIRDWRPKAEKDGVKLLPADGVGYFQETPSTEPPWKGCNAGITSCGIMSDGRVKGCLSWPDSMVEGDLRKESLWNIWFREEAFSRTRNVRREDFGGACRGCAKAPDCGGGCTTMSLAATGRLHADPYCFQALNDNRATVGVTA